MGSRGVLSEPRRAQDAHADHAADDDRESEAEPEQATELVGGERDLALNAAPPPLVGFALRAC